MSNGVWAWPLPSNGKVCYNLLYEICHQPTLTWYFHRFNSSLFLPAKGVSFQCASIFCISSIIRCKSRTARKRRLNKTQTSHQTCSQYYRDNSSLPTRVPNLSSDEIWGLFNNIQNWKVQLFKGYKWFVPDMKPGFYMSRLKAGNNPQYT